ncbi:hypothetical protein AVEN_253405-1 [Araneus ventricosus]|uniref:Uncharacterized protein n=1 Tax=Araneus ventricosus TaxID=182803 RepID=A0A4Y2MKB6_ARAVE|nr:hypothetical protein AVEN_253405-1 [Araneus ventricosus]
MLECIDRFQQEIDTRCEGIECVSDWIAVSETSNLTKTSETELPKYAQSLFESYNELPRLRRFLKAASSKRSVSWLDLIRILRVCG